MSPGRSSAANPVSASLLTTESNSKPSGPEAASFTVTVVEMLISLWSGGHNVFRLGATEQVGAVLSTLMVTLRDAGPPVLLAEHVKLVPAVSLVTVCVAQPLVDVIVDSLSTTLHDTVTLLVYQPFEPSTPVTVGVMTGGVLSILMTTVLSVLVDARLPLPAPSMAPLAAIDAVTVPVAVIPLTATSKVVPSLGAISVSAAEVAPAVPPRMTPDDEKPVTGTSKTAVKWIGLVVVGSSCPG